jgi:hypothetical protein
MPVSVVLAAFARGVMPILSRTRAKTVSERGCIVIIKSPYVYYKVALTHHGRVLEY